MFEQLIELAKAQPILVGGIGTVVSGSLLYTIHAVPRSIGTGIKNSLISTIYVDNRNDFYDDINHHVYNNRIPWTFRQYEPTTSNKRDTPAIGFSSREKKLDYRLQAGYGSGWGKWDGIYFKFSKSLELKGNDPLKKLNIQLYTRNIQKVEEFFIQAAKISKGKTVQRISVSNGDYWERTADKSLRDLKTVFMQEETKSLVVNSLKEFTTKESWYEKRGIPYKFCMFFHGVPGTGKTSLIHALASTFGYQIAFLTSLKNLTSLLTEMSTDRSMLVIEDIDTLSKLDREQNENYLHELLNSLDGFTCQHGLVVAMTSNHPQNLDPALLRPGRIDLNLEIGALDYNSAREMFNAYFPSVNTFDSLESVYRPMTGATLQQIFINADDAAKAIAAIRG